MGTYPYVVQRRVPFPLLPTSPTAEQAAVQSASKNVQLVSVLGPPTLAHRVVIGERTVHRIAIRLIKPERMTGVRAAQTPTL